MKERLDNTIASEAGNPQLGETLRYQKEMASFKVWSNKAKAQERAFIAFLRNMKQLSWSNKTVAQKEQQQSRSKQHKQKITVFRFSLHSKCNKVFTDDTIIYGFSGFILVQRHKKVFPEQNQLSIFIFVQQAQ